MDRSVVLGAITITLSVRIVEIGLSPGVTDESPKLSGSSMSVEFAVIAPLSRDGPVSHRVEGQLSCSTMRTSHLA